MRFKGMSVVELLAFIGFLVVAVIVGWWQLSLAAAGQRDSARKAAVNAMYYQLTDVYYATHHSYPPTLSEAALAGIDTKYLRDPRGKAMTDPTSDIRYQPYSCNGLSCAGFRLQARLEQEADFVQSTN